MIIFPNCIVHKYELNHNVYFLVVWAQSVAPNLTYCRIFENFMCTCFWTLKGATKASLLIPQQRFTWHSTGVLGQHNTEVAESRTAGFSYGIRYAFIAIQWILSHSSINHNENLPYPVWKCLPYGIPQSFY